MFPVASLSRGLALVLSCWVLLPGGAGAQAFPTRPITLVSPFTVGANTDLVLREIAAAAAKSLGQPVVFESRPGANNRLGINAVRKAPGDGYLVTVASDGLLVLQPLADPEFRLESGKDYLPITFAFEFPLILVANNSMPFRDLKGLISYARENPNKLNFVVSSTTIFLAERFRHSAAIEVVMVPYKGSAQATQDQLAGRVHLNFTGTVAAPFINAGKLVAIATSGTRRWAPFPDVPTLEEGGVPVSATTWFSYVAPPKTSADVIAKLNLAFNAALKTPEVVKQLERYGMAAGRMTTPGEFGQFIQAEINAWAPIVKKAGIKLD